MDARRPSPALFPGTGNGCRRGVVIAKSAAPLFLFWMAITESVSPADLATGIILSLAVGTLAAQLLWLNDAPVLTVRKTLRLLAYLPVLAWEIVRSAAHVAGIVFNPNMPVNPEVVRYSAGFTRLVSRVAFANSVTMTPGTLTVDLDGDDYIIHCLDHAFAVEVQGGVLERRISKIFE